MTANIKRPVAVPVSRGWLPEIDKTLRKTFSASSEATIANRHPSPRVLPLHW
jgi:hypothetical protein